MRALAALRRGLMIAQNNGQRGYETHMAASLARLEAKHGDPLSALSHLTLAIRNYNDSGNKIQMQTALAILTPCLGQLGRYESAATIASFARSPFSAACIPELDAATHKCARSSATRPTNRSPARVRRRPPPPS